MRLLAMSLVLALAACPGDTADPPDPDSPVVYDLPVYPDLGNGDLPLFDQLIDGPSVQEGPPPDGPAVDTPGGQCSVKTADGIALNPGCDPDFQANGPTALGQFLVINTGQPAWLFTSGTKWWLFDTTARGGSGAFTAGGKDLATTLTALQPTACTAVAADGTPLNPGCDPTFKANGPTALGSIQNASGKAVWFFSSGKKFWIYDTTGGAGGQGAFTAAGADIAIPVAALTPTSCTTAPSGMYYNPSCDTTFQANGPTAWGEFTTGSSGQKAWLFVSGIKWWIFDPQNFKMFTAAGADISQNLVALQPGCTAKAADGSFLNPGCDPAFKVNGPTAIGEFTAQGTNQSTWLFTMGKKYWLFDTTASGGNGAFTAAGASIADATRLLYP